MPQLAYLTQFLWLCLFFFSFYIFICNYGDGLLGICRILNFFEGLHHDILFFLILILVFVLWILVRALWHFHYQKNKKSLPSCNGDVKLMTLFHLVLFFFFMVVVFIPQISECAGDNPLSEEGGSSSNPLSRFKPSKTSLDVLEQALKAKRDKEFPPSTSLEPNENILHGYLNTLTSRLNEILVEHDYKKINKYTVEKMLFELKTNNCDLFSFYVDMGTDLSKNKEESLLYSSLLKKGFFKKKG